MVGRCYLLAGFLAEIFGPSLANVLYVGGRRILAQLQLNSSMALHRCSLSCENIEEV